MVVDEVDIMKINFPKISIIDAAAERVHQYVISHPWKNDHPENLKSTYNIRSLRDIISRCYGYKSYKEIRENLSHKKPQYNSLSEIEINELNHHQLSVLSLSLKIPHDIAKNLWWAMTPCIDLSRSRYNKKLTIGQIGKTKFTWKRPKNLYKSEYEDNGDGNDAEVVAIYEYVIALRCPRCDGEGITGTVDDKKRWKVFSLQRPPIQPEEYSVESCSLCGADERGIYYHPDPDLNHIRLTIDQQLLRDEFGGYVERQYL